MKRQMCVKYMQHSLGHMPRYAFDVEGGHREGGGRSGAIIPLSSISIVARSLITSRMHDVKYWFARLVTWARVSLLIYVHMAYLRYLNAQSAIHALCSVIQRHLHGSLFCLPAMP